jgi:hypothetical protein
LLIMPTAQASATVMHKEFWGSMASVCKFYTFVSTQ